jgi:hypothetical protein
VTARRPRPTVTMEPRWVDLTTASAAFGLSETKLSELITHAGLPHLREGGRIILQVAATDAWLAARAAGAPLEVAS